MEERKFNVDLEIGQKFWVVVLNEVVQRIFEDTIEMIQIVFEKDKDGNFINDSCVEGGTYSFELTTEDNINFHVQQFSCSDSDQIFFASSKKEAQKFFDENSPKFITKKIDEERALYERLKAKYEN